LWCWGFNGYGQLGTGNYTSQWRRQQVTGCRQMTLSPPAPYASIAAALRHHARRPERPLRTIMNS
jgi:hypothetical protein